MNECIAMISYTDIHGSQRKNVSDSGDPLTFSWFLVKCLNNYWKDFHEIWYICLTFSYRVIFFCLLLTCSILCSTLYDSLSRTLCLVLI